jgi:arylsulfatase A-like enzyme
VRPNIVLIVFDTARADAFEPYGASVGSSPTVAQLASSGSAHQKAYSTASWTAPAHGSLFSGLLPRSAGMAHVGGLTAPAIRAALAEREASLLPNVLRKAGYVSLGVSTNLWVSPDSGFDGGFDAFRYITGGRNKGLHRTDVKGRAKFVFEAVQAKVDDGATAVEALLRGWMSDRRDQPFFLFVNLVECHSPYLPPKPWNKLRPWDRARTALEAQRHLTFDSVWRASAGGFNVPERALDRMRRNYAASIRQMDDWLARVMTFLDERGILGDTEIVLTSDHGENFGEGRLMGHAFSLDDRLIRVPFVVSGPVDLPENRVLSVADVPRLLAHVAALDDHPWGDQLSGEVAVAQFDAPVVAGDPAVADMLRIWDLGPDTARHLVTSFACATDGQLKLVRRGDDEEILDLASDPLELTPLPASAAGAAGYEQRLRPLRQALDRAEAAERPPAMVTEPSKELPPEDVTALEDQMRLLGYL